MDSLIAGAAAGLVVDLTLYPIDTIKTRMQSKIGFLRSGGFSGVYRGISAVAVGSIPGGAAFFVGYDITKRALLGAEAERKTEERKGPKGHFFTYAIAAMAGETAACLTRAPTEMVKQQLQAGQHKSIRRALAHITHGPSFHSSSSSSSSCSSFSCCSSSSSESVRGIRWCGLPRLFVGMPVMLMRELPFAVLQMSCYEGLKAALRTDQRPQFLPLCGAVSGGAAAFFTTPLDVLKTRIMLGQFASHKEARGIAAVRAAFHDVMHEAPRASDRWGRPQRFFRGVVPRVMWIAMGGSVFFTTYETVRSGCQWIGKQ